MGLVQMGLKAILPFFLFLLIRCLFVFSLLFLFCFLVFLRYPFHCHRTRASDYNLPQKWGISLRSRLHRPRSELPEFWP